MSKNHNLGNISLLLRTNNMINDSGMVFGDLLVKNKNITKLNL